MGIGLTLKDVEQFLIDNLDCQIIEIKELNTPEYGGFYRGITILVFTKKTAKEIHYPLYNLMPAELKLKVQNIDISDSLKLITISNL